MLKKTSGIGEFLAVAMAIATVVASVLLLFFYGKVDVLSPGKYGLSPTVEKVANWPLIVSVSVSAIYSVLFAMMFCYVEATRNAVVALVEHFGIKQDEQKKQ